MTYNPETLQVQNALTLAYTNLAVAEELSQARNEYWVLPENLRYSLSTASREFRNTCPNSLTASQQIVWDWASNFLTYYNRCVNESEVIRYCIRNSLRTNECVTLFRQHRLMA